MKKYNNPNDLHYLSILLVSPAIKIGDIQHNQELIIQEIIKHPNVNLFVFPELSLTGATLGDFFLKNELLSEINRAIQNIIDVSHKQNTTIILGTPLLIQDKLTNAALFISKGKLLGIVPKNIENR